jgi:hypothetical protein
MLALRHNPFDAQAHGRRVALHRHCNATLRQLRSAGLKQFGASLRRAVTRAARFAARVARTPFCQRPCFRPVFAGDGVSAASAIWGAARLAETTGCGNLNRNRSFENDQGREG